MPQLSVVVPCYNAASYLEACLDSLCAQTATDLEIVVVDDGSTDGSGPLLDALAQRDPRICALHQANAGVSAARNAGLDAARGDFVAFVDADDLLPPDALAVLLDRIQADPSMDIVSSLIRERHEDGTVRTIQPSRHCRTCEQVISLLIEGDGVYNSMCDKLYRRALLERWHIRAQVGLRIGEDCLFNLEAYAHARAIAHLPIVTYEYRMHGASAMHGVEQRQHYIRHLPWLNGMRETLQRLGLREAFFRDYCFSHTLRLYKERGLRGVLRDFGHEVRPAALEGVDPHKLRATAWPLYASIRLGLFPYAYCFLITVRRARNLLARIVHR